MPYTRDINDYYSITVSPDGKNGEVHTASATIFRRDNQQRVAIEHRGEGRTLSKAEERAFGAARIACPIKPPKDWKPRER